MTFYLNFHLMYISFFFYMGFTTTFFYLTGIPWWKDPSERVERAHMHTRTHTHTHTPPNLTLPCFCCITMDKSIHSVYLWSYISLSFMPLINVAWFFLVFRHALSMGLPVNLHSMMPCTLDENGNHILESWILTIELGPLKKRGSLTAVYI
ncbi:hypothetical protein BJV82DRAFT_111306 [Fennellomyces sp. T-0311]|nr:hypothetical protein BJV82DRAFT_111306 [Fennellomyces sp. T-0311]